MLVLDTDRMSVLEWISLSRDATLLSANLADFRKVPGLNVQDWTR